MIISTVKKIKLNILILIKSVKLKKKNCFKFKNCFYRFCFIESNPLDGPDERIKLDRGRIRGRLDILTDKKYKKFNPNQ